MKAFGLARIGRDAEIRHTAGGDAVASLSLAFTYGRKGEDGKFVWPGYGENMRVLKWMIDRIEGKAQGTEHVFGVSPAYEELNWTGLNFSAEQFKSVISIDKAVWQKELELHAELFQQLAYHLPAELTATKAKIEQRLAA